MITVAVVEFWVDTVTGCDALTPPLGTLLKISGFAAVVMGVTVSCGCA